MEDTSAGAFRISRAVEVFNGMVKIADFRSGTLFTVITPKKTATLWVSRNELAAIADCIQDFLDADKESL